VIGKRAWFGTRLRSSTVGALEIRVSSYPGSRSRPLLRPVQLASVVLAVTLVEHGEDLTHLVVRGAQLLVVRRRLPDLLHEPLTPIAFRAWKIVANGHSNLVAYELANLFACLHDGSSFWRTTAAAAGDASLSR